MAMKEGCITINASNKDTVRSKGNCDVAKKTTHVIGPYSKIETLVELPLTSPIPKSVYFRVEAWDSDYTSGDDLIGKFYSDEVHLSAKTDFHTLTLMNRNVTAYNSHVKINAFFGLTCSLHYYGPQCENYCKSDFKTYHCGVNGERKCLPGWNGEVCNKVDMCFLKPCAPYARCTNTDTEEGRICYCNGGNGPECYQVPDPCEPSPCQNDGECSKTGPHLEQFVCECKSPWYGPTCQQRYSACADAMTMGKTCFNGGLCQDDPNEFTFTCACPIGWKGDYCEDKDYTAAVLTPIILIIIVTVIALLLFFFWRKRRQSTKTRPTIFVPHREQPVMSGNGPSAPQDALAISNDIYGVKYSQVHEVQFLSEEDEYSMVHDKPPPHPVRKSYEGAIRYASLLWDKTTKSVRSSKNKEEKPQCETPSLPPRTDEMTTPLIGVADERLVGRQSFLDRPSKSVYERSKEEGLEEMRSPLPVKDPNTNQKLKKNVN